MKCPKCGSDKVSRYTNHSIDCDACGYTGRGEEFGEARRIEPRTQVSDAALAGGDLDAWRQILGFPK